METYLSEEQFGFRKGKGTTDAMFIVRQMMGRKLEFQQESSWDFLDLERAHDKINREMIPPVIRQYHVPEELISPLLFVILLDYISNGANGARTEGYLC